MDRHLCNAKPDPDRIRIVMEIRIRIGIKTMPIHITRIKWRYIFKNYIIQFVTIQVPLITTPSLQQPIMMASTLEPSGHKKS